MLSEILFTWHLPPASEKELQEADVIIGQSFGYRSDGPGLCNVVLANVAEGLHRLYGLPLILQGEIAAVCAVKVHHSVRSSIYHPTGFVPNTYEVIGEAYNESQKMGWKRAIILAHPLHMWRCMKVAEKLGFRAVPAPVPQIPFDKDSAQWQIRSKGAYIAYELLARAEFLRCEYI